MARRWREVVWDAVKALLCMKLRMVAAVAPLLLASALSLSLARPYTVGWKEDIGLHSVAFKRSEQLEALFMAYQYEWPPQAVIPPLGLKRFPSDLPQLETARKKSLFFRGLLPLVEAENARLRAQRTFLLEKFALGELRAGTRSWAQVQRLAESYKVPGDVNDPYVREILLRRVDEVPAGLVLAQAANESGWGNSRFAREANNLFGHYTYKEDLGMIPARREEGASHYIRIFPDLRSSVRAYLRNINVGHAYLELRRLRARMRADGVELDSGQLAEGLIRYSERGGEYVNEIRAMINSNGLDRIGPLTFTPS